MKKKLLLVDDEKFFLEGLQDGLSEYSHLFTTDICFSVEEAKKLQKKNTYDLIVSDIRMPKKSGLDLFIYLRKKKFKGGFIAMTAYGTEDLLKNIRELGGLDSARQKVYPSVRHYNESRVPTSLFLFLFLPKSGQLSVCSQLLKPI